MGWSSYIFIDYLIRNSVRWGHLFVVYLGVCMKGLVCFTSLGKENCKNFCALSWIKVYCQIIVKFCVDFFSLFFNNVAKI